MLGILLGCEDTVGRKKPPFLPCSYGISTTVQARCAQKMARRGWRMLAKGHRSGPGRCQQLIKMLQ